LMLEFLKYSLTLLLNVKKKAAWLVVNFTCTVVI
jgi:hypothetical protein